MRNGRSRADRMNRIRLTAPKTIFPPQIPSQGATRPSQGQPFAEGDEDIIGQDDHEADRESARPAAFFRGEPEGQAHEDEDEADERQGEALVAFDEKGSDLPSFWRMPKSFLIAFRIIYAGGRGGRVPLFRLRQAVGLGPGRGQGRPEFVDVLLPGPLFGRKGVGQSRRSRFPVPYGSKSTHS